MDLRPFNVSHNLSLTFNLVSSNLSHSVSGELVVSSTSPWLGPVLAVGGTLLIGSVYCIQYVLYDHVICTFGVYMIRCQTL